MSKVIFTADDFGVIDSINKGITDLVLDEIITSVEVLSNYGKQGVKSIANTKSLINATEPYGVVPEIGVHLTITSGKPLTGIGDTNIIDSHGNFKEFTNLQKNVPIELIKKELVCQVEVLKSDNLISPHITHLTNHHDSLWFFENYTRALIEVSDQFCLPIRNPRSVPKLRNRFYSKVVVPLLGTLGEMPKPDRKEVKTNYKLRRKGLFPNSAIQFLSTDYMDSRFYGPIPQFEINREREILRNISKKLKKMHKMIDRATDQGRSNDIVEFMFHLRKGAIAINQNQYLSEFQDYTGIDYKAFDSRTLEYLTLKEHKQIIHNYMQQRSLNKGKWKDVKMIKFARA